MPRKQLVHCRFDSNMPQERRTEPRHENQCHQQPSTSLTPLTLAPASISYADKAITIGRRIDFRFFQKERFFVEDKIKIMTWGFLCTLDLPTYPGLVREFYSTLVRGSEGFTCKVKRVDITVN